MTVHRAPHFTVAMRRGVVILKELAVQDLQDGIPRALRLIVRWPLADQIIAPMHRYMDKYEKVVKLKQSAQEPGVYRSSQELRLGPLLARPQAPWDANHNGGGLVL